MSNTSSINWLFGRGLSIGCNLTWTVPEEWSGNQREEKIEKIKQAIRIEMGEAYINSSVLVNYLEVLSEKTTSAWKNRFITTNWDFLLQREILGLDLTDLPDWMANSHVYHLNGTVEELDDNSNRSPFLLEEDPSEQRCFTPEANMAYTHMTVEQLFVVVGMSFECEIDKFLLNSLNRVEDNMPIGNSTWIIVNRNQDTLDVSGVRIGEALPRANVIKVCDTFDSWLKKGFPELQAYGALTS